MKNLSGKIAVVTGAGSGIGRSIAIALAARGAHVVVADIQPASAAAVRDELLAMGARAIAVTVDVARRESVVELADEAWRAFDRVDILCNNAGVSWRPFRTVLEATMEDWNFILGVNLWGVVHGLDVFLPRMRGQAGEKHIVNTASLGGLLPLAGHTPYSASKAAVAFISESIAQELASEGFGVTVLCPGFVHTNVRANSDALRPAEERAENRNFTPFENPLLGRLALTAMQPDAVGTMVCNAILDGTLYLNTQPVPADIVEERMRTMFGPQTVGRA
jgi:NAD(P)-dependent dehydrogenase (short-subunit alcohol dehydrogenase family)